MKQMFDLNPLKWEIEDILETRRLDKPNDIGCWNWSGGVDAKGYGLVCIRPNHSRYPRQTFRVHRLSYWFYKGFDIYNGDIQVNHKCDNPQCYNPDHLFLGDNFVNQQDRVAKGRHIFAEYTHCKEGHPYSGDNLLISNGSRSCRTCLNKNSKEWQRLKGGYYDRHPK